MLRDRAHNVSETLDDVDLSLAWPSISKSFGATGRFVWHERAGRREHDARRLRRGAGRQPHRPEAAARRQRRSRSPSKARISVKPTLKIEGTLAADSPSLRDALVWAGQKPLPGGGFGHFAIKAQTNVDGRHDRRSPASMSSSTATPPRACSPSSPTAARPCRARSPPTSSISRPTSRPSRLLDRQSARMEQRRRSRSTASTGTRRRPAAVGRPRSIVVERQVRPHRDRRQSARRPSGRHCRRGAGLWRRDQGLGDARRRREPASTSNRSCNSTTSISKAASASCSACAASRAKATSPCRSKAPATACSA